MIIDMHREVKQYFQYVKSIYPQYFSFKSVLDVGSLDVNGTNRHLFKFCSYTGIDIIKGRNVDIVCPVHELEKTNRLPFNVVICSGMLEHDRFWDKSLRAMYNLTVPNGLLLITAAGKNFPEHGTTRTTPKDSPATNDYYRNITREMLFEVFDDIDSLFDNYQITETKYPSDIYFWGIKL